MNVYQRTLYPVVLAVVLLFGLAACGASEPAAQQAPANADEPAAAEVAAEDAHSEGEDHAHSEGEDHAHSEGEDHAHSEGEDHAHSEDLTAALTPVEGDEPINVVASTTIVGDVVRQVGGDDINLTVLMPPGADSHGFEPTPQEAAVVAEADVVFVNGMDLEEALMPIIENSGIAPERIIGVSHGVETIEFAGGHDHADEEHSHDEEHSDEEHSHDDAQSFNPLDLFVRPALAHGDEEHGDEEHAHDHSGADPHTWMSPINVMVWTENVAAVLSTLDPDNAETYAANAERYEGELQQLDSDIAEQVATIPAANRYLVTDHRAFGYFAHEYGLEQVGAVIPAYSTTAETSAQDLAALQETISEYGVPAIFVGTTTNPSLSEQIAADMGVNVLEVYTGSLSEADGDAATYVDMMRFNTAQFVEGLSG